MNDHRSLLDRVFSRYAHQQRFVDWKQQGGQKMPFTPGTRRQAAVDDPNTWGVLADCGPRPGVVLTGDGLVALDLDGCRDPETGETADWASEALRRFGSYAEVSPSGNGYHVFCLVELPADFPNKLTVRMPGEPIMSKRPQIEVLTDKTYCTVTGDAVPGCCEEIRRVSAEQWDWLKRQQSRRRTAAPDEGSRSAKADEGRNGALFSLGCRLRSEGKSDDEVEAELRHANVAGNVELHPNFAEGPLPEPEFRTLLRSVLKYQKEPRDERAPVVLRASRLDEVARAAEDALIAAGSPVYTQGGRLVHAVVEQADASRGRKTCVTRIVACDQGWLARELSKVVRFVKCSAKGEPAPADAPKPLVEALLSSASPEFPELGGIIETPTLRPDGTVLASVGYDPPTGLLLVNPPPMAPISERPTRGEAEQALATLLEPLNEFPFADDASRSVALSALITPVVRGAMPFAPIHAATAPVAGTGKSYVFDLAAAIAIGNHCPVLSAGKKEEETEKRLHGALLSGQPIISIDNLNGTLHGAFTCQLVTQRLLEIRKMGVTGNIRAQNCATVFANGNNLEIEGDLVRRTILCSLDPEMENPEARKFRGDPFRAILADRGRWVAAVLTVVLAHLEAGAPGTALVKPYAGFEDWSRVVRGALVWLGQADPVSTQESLRVEDPAVVVLDLVMEAWAEELQGGNIVDRPMTVKELAGQNSEPFLRELRNATDVRGEFDPLNAVKVGQFLKRHKDRIRHGMKLVSQTKHKQQAWQLTGWRDFLMARDQKTAGTTAQVVSLDAQRRASGRKATRRATGENAKVGGRAGEAEPSDPQPER